MRELAVTAADRILNPLNAIVLSLVTLRHEGAALEARAKAVATVEKAIFDYFYVACASGHPRRRLPELDLPRDFSENDLRGWIGRIRSPRLRTLVEAAVARALEHAEREDARP